MQILIVVSRFIHVTEEQEVRQQEQQQLGVETKHKRIEPTGNDKTNGKGERRSVDIKGAATLATAVTSFLLALTYLETGNRGQTSMNSLQTIFLVIGIISLALLY